MADITYTVNMNVSKDLLTQVFQASGIGVGMQNSGFISQTLSPGTTAAATAVISTATMNTVGMFFARHISPGTVFVTSQVSFGPLVNGEFVKMITLKQGEVAVGRLSTGKTYACQSNQTGTQLLISILEN